MAAAFFARFEEAAEGGGVGLVGEDLDGVHAGVAEEAEDFGLRFGLAGLEQGAIALAGGVDFYDVAGLGVLQDKPAERRKFAFVTVGDEDGDDVVAAVGLTERGEGEAFHVVGARAVAEEEVGEDDDDGAMGGDAAEEFEGLVDVGGVVLRLEEKNFADDAQDVAAAFAGRDVFLDDVGEEDEADLVVVADGGEGEDGGDLGGEFALGLGAGTERAGAAEVHEEHDGEFAFLDEFFDEGMVHPRGDIPVDGAHVVAGLVFAHLVEVHALAFEHAVVLARERLGHEAVGANLDLADFFEDFAGDHWEGNAEGGMANGEWGREKKALCAGQAGRYFAGMSAMEIMEEMRRMPEAERRDLTEKILEEFGYLEDGPTPEQLAEFERRGEQLRRNPQNGIPWEQVRAELKERIKDRTCLAK